jgi:hypothetical protein
MVRHLQCFRGISIHSAMVLATEIVDWRRFEWPAQLACYLGLVSREASSGDRQRLGSIPKAGNNHCRHVLVQAAWSYRHRPQTSVDLKRRQEGQPPAVITHAWKAQQRLYQRFNHLSYRTRPQIAVVAVARELVGFLWAVMQDVPHAPQAAYPNDRRPACGVEARCASMLDGVMRAGQGATPASPSLE